MDIKLIDRQIYMIHSQLSQLCNKLLITHDKQLMKIEAEHNRLMLILERLCKQKEILNKEYIIY
jgi:hypothetical protein